MAVKASSMADATGARCPICRKPAVQETRPFCSKRCADIDLARWLGGGYVIAGSNRLADEDAELSSASTGDRTAIPGNGEDESR
jgi:hypothetical protein